MAHAFSDSKWDCKLDSDGKTWDCGVSKESIQKKSKPTTSTSKTTEKGTLPKKVSSPQAIAARSSSTNPIATNADWNCQPGVDGTWECKQTASKRSAPSSAVFAASNGAVATQYAQTTQTGSISNRAKNEALFKQMVSQLEDNPWDTCTVTKKTAADNQTTTQQRLAANVDVTADYTELKDKNTALFAGNVIIQRADQQLSANQINYQHKENIASASGNVFYQENGLSLHSDNATLQLNKNTGEFENTQLIIEQSHIRITSDSTKFINRDVSQSENITYTTCAPGNSDWQLEAKNLELNNATGIGTARDVWVEFFDIPFIYTPYISFPIDDRRISGLLAPTFGNSDTTGTDLSIPYYWNIAPNRDATITPRIMSDRGLMLGGEFRYLNSISESKIAAEIIDDTELDELRGQFSLQNKARFSPRLTTDVDLNYISDDDYHEDFGNSLISASNRYIKSHAKANYNADDWTLLANIDNYDSIDESISSSERPHRRLPQLVFNLKPIDVLNGSKFNMRNEFVYYDHSADVRAKRLDIQPSISHTIRSPSSFITPKLSVRHTSYRLDNQAAGVNARQDRTLPILSVDSGLFFERELDMAGGFTQTLEPRAFYLYVPHKNQDDIPLFDTSEYDFSFNQLFRENRFSGADRVADANQLTLAVTTRFIEQQSGRERLRASIGTIVYFDELDVTLNPSDTPVDTDSSDIVGELATKLSDHWSARSSLQLDPHKGKTQKSTLGVYYRDGENRIFNATYRSRYSATDDDIEQTDISFKWPLSKSWSTVGRWNYSEEHNLSLETFLGLEKDTCCWRFRVLAKRYVNDAFDEEPKEGLFFQLQLKGLTSFGDKVESVLEEGIRGYTASEH